MLPTNCNLQGVVAHAGQRERPPADELVPTLVVGYLAGARLQAGATVVMKSRQKRDTSEAWMSCNAGELGCTANIQTLTTHIRLLKLAVTAPRRIYKIGE